MPTPAKHRSACPLNAALEVYGDRWTLLIIRDLMFKEKAGYSEFLASEEGISTNIIELAPVLTEMIIWGARYAETDAPPEVIREMEENRENFLRKVRARHEAAAKS
jgi:DNA-binding HxlR family transcriptional regulator